MQENKRKIKKTTPNKLLHTIEEVSIEESVRKSGCEDLCYHKVETYESLINRTMEVSGIKNHSEYFFEY